MVKDEEDCIAKIEKKNKEIKDDDQFKNEKRKIIRTLFRKLNRFLERNDYLEMGSFEE
jgi:hypothetical protein